MNADPRDFSMNHTANVNGIDINYRLDGPDGAPVVVLCHGLLGNLHMWDGQMSVLTPRYRVLRFDNRGHGGTQVAAPPYTIELLTEDTRALLDVFDIEVVHFVGASLGGMIGQLLAVKHPERLRSLIFVGTLSYMPPPQMWDERIRIAREQGLEALAPTMLERWFTPEFHQRNPDAVAPILNSVLNTDVDGFVGACEAIKAMYLTPLLSRIATPALVLGADQDPGVPVSETEMIHRKISGSEMKIIGGARHLFCIERATKFNAILMDFLDRH
jgi:3-oxoadipate enol-lactonase